MKKITYRTSNLFSLKKYNHADTLAQSYEYPTIYGIRCAIIGAIIQTDGIEKAKELFFKVKNSNIYIQYPKLYFKTVIKQSRLKTTDKRSKKEKDDDEKNGITPNLTVSTMGAREYLDLKEVVFYIDNLIPNIEMYLKNIDWIGNAESMVYLDKIEEVNLLENILKKWDKKNCVEIFEQHDWNSKTSFDSIYTYSNQYKHHHDTFYCEISNILL